jgi:hypothetical protein
LQVAPPLTAAATFLGVAGARVRKSDLLLAVEEQFAYRLLTMQQDTTPPVRKDENGSFFKKVDNSKFLKILVVISVPDYSANQYHCP